MNKLQVHTDNKYYSFINDNYPVIIGLFIRILFYIFFSVNNFNYPDEISFLYNCKTLLENGTDALGQSYPIYFNTWLVGGHSPLPIYVTALSVKLFGVNFAALKFPSLFLACITFIIFSKLISLLIEDKEKCKIIVLLEAFCAGSIFTAAFMLDCWWMNYFITFGLYAFYYGIKSNKKRYLYLSTLFFCLSFYCYIAAVFIIPFLLLCLYIVQLKDKKIKFRTAVFNCIEALIISLPFIIFGLVALEKIKPFEFLGITFPDMSLYIRDSFVKFNASYIIKGLVYTICNWSFFENGLDVGLCVLAFAILILTNKIKPQFKKSLKKEILIPFFVPYIIFILFTQTCYTYRIGSFLVLLTIPVFSVLADVIEKKTVKRAFFMYLSSLVIVYLIMSSCAMHSINKDNPITYISENNIQADIYIHTEENYEQEKADEYEEAWISYKFRLSFPKEEYVDFKEEQIERYYGNNTVQISDRIKITNNIKDINDDKYLLTLNEDDYAGRTLVQTYKNWGAHLNTWYLYSPVSEK